MTSYFSPAVLGLFAPLSVIAYQLFPRRARWAALLGASLVFFWALSGRLVAFVLASAAVVWVGGMALGALARSRDRALAAEGAERRRVRRAYQRRMRAVLAVGVLLNVGILVALKYLGFLGSVAEGLGLGLPSLPSIGVPIGISFYTLQAVSYLTDVYRGVVPADANPARLALFLTFFPQVMEGPIARYSQTAQALWSGRPVTARGLFLGGTRVLWGLSKYLLVANRLNSFVKPVFADPASYDGSVIAMAAVLYTMQLYCDFSGTIDFAVGMARVFGVEEPENFRQPFLSRTASEFWQRWHVTLGSWLKDYVFYPVSLSRPVKHLTGAARRALGVRVGPAVASGVALLCVWVANGLWHGAGTQYLLFGLYYFVIIWLGGIVAPLSEGALARVGVSRDALPWRAFQHVRTLLVVFAGELLFRASGAQEGISMLLRTVTDFAPASFVDGTMLGVGMDLHDFAVVGAFAVLLLVVGLARERGSSPLERVWERGPAARLAIVTALVVMAVVFGAYGVGYVPVDPMYAQF